MCSMVRILFLGDVVGKAGRVAVQRAVPELRKRLSPHLIIANGENAAGGVGIDPSTAEELFQTGVQVITTGNHIWNRKEIRPYLDANRHRIIRPANFSTHTPGVGAVTVLTESGVRIGVMNLIGRVFMPDLVDSPFAAADQLLSKQLADTKVVFVDFHGEATSEKIAMAHHLNGRVSAVVGTHTHVQTADERILAGGTATITDVGMCGPFDSVIGVEVPKVVERFVTGLPVRFEVADGKTQINGVLLTVDPESGRALQIERINEVEK